MMIWRGNITKLAGVKAMRMAMGAHQRLENASTHSTARSTVTTSASGVNFHSAASTKVSTMPAAMRWTRRLDKSLRTGMLGGPAARLDVAPG
jgi:tRNA C32,U32 (ribose-2'-O)-methylase TrmJ